MSAACQQAHSPDEAQRNPGPQVEDLHKYLREIENRTTSRLSLTDTDFDAIAVDRNFVKETAAVYSIR